MTLNTKLDFKILKWQFWAMKLQHFKQLSHKEKVRNSLRVKTHSEQKIQKS